MPPIAGPGLKNALAMARSATVRALSLRRVRCAPSDSHWNTPIVSPRASRSAVAGIVQRDLGQAERRVAVPAHQLGSVGQHGQRADAQQVHLGQAQRLHVAVLELGDEESPSAPTAPARTSVSGPGVITTPPGWTLR